jgi:hypothetical protein
LVVGASGIYAQVTVPVEDEPTIPATSASVGILRPEVTRTYLVRATILGTISTVLTVTSGLRAPHSWSFIRGYFLQQPSSHPWIVPGMMGAPKLVTPLNLTLAVVLVVSGVLALIYSVLGVSARAWLAYHGNLRSSYPVLWEVPLSVVVVSLVYAAITGSQPFSPADPFPDVGLLGGFVAGTPTSITLGTVAIVSVVVLSALSLALPLSDS